MILKLLFLILPMSSVLIRSASILIILRIINPISIRKMTTANAEAIQIAIPMIANVIPAVVNTTVHQIEVSLPRRNLLHRLRGAVTDDHDDQGRIHPQNETVARPVYWVASSNAVDGSTLTGNWIALLLI